MKRSLWLLALIFAIGSVNPAAAKTRLIVRNTLGSVVMNLTCGLLNCNVNRGLGDPNGQLFSVSFPNTLSGVFNILKLITSPGIAGVEIDQPVNVLAQASASGAPAALYDSAPMNYYGTTVRHGYVYQPANQLVRTLDAQRTFHVAGSGIVAVIDTGVDTTHPVLRSSLVAGYNFVRNNNNPDEKADLDQSTAAVLDQSTAAVVDGDNEDAAEVNQSTAAVLDQSTAAVLDGNPAYSDFGHGTMTSGVIHLVAPRAKIMPLKAFAANGSGYASDVLRAIYWAANHNAKVINMSFSFGYPSPELTSAVNYAMNRGLICVAAAGNDGRQTMVYPAGINGVMGVASTDDSDQRSSFSNYGNSLVWVAAPGEGVVTTYPFGHYAAAWGTSFSTPFVSGAAALLNNASPVVNDSIAETAIANAQPVDPNLHYGRLDVYQAVQGLGTAVTGCSTGGTVVTSSNMTVNMNCNISGGNTQGLLQSLLGSL